MRRGRDGFVFRTFGRSDGNFLRNGSLFEVRVLGRESLHKRQPEDLSFSFSRFNGKRREVKTLNEVTYESDFIVPDVLLVVFDPDVFQVFQSFDVHVVENLLSEFTVSERVEPEFGNFLGKFGTSFEYWFLEGNFVNVYIANENERRESQSRYMR